MPDEIGMPDYEDEGIEAFTEDDLNLSSAEGIPSEEAAEEKPKAQRKKRRSYTRDDMGNAERLLAESGEDLRWDDGIGEWVVWDGKRWVVDSHEAMRRAKRVPRSIVERAASILSFEPDDKKAQSMLKWGEASGNLSRLEAMLKTARSEPGVSVTSADFDRDPRLLNCPNGVLMLGRKGATWREVRKSDLSTKVTGCEYHADARSPMWDNFLDTFLPEIELRDWAQRLAGYSMFGANPARKIVFVWGPTSSGKSTFAELVQEALGTYSGGFNLSMLRDNQDERARPDLVRAMPQRAIFASETSSAWKLHADMIKRATGQDKILARLPHVGAGVERIPAFTPWIVTNGIPTIDGADTALYRRLATVLFPHTIAQEAEKMGWRDELLERGELPGVLAWLVEGWNMFCEDGLNEPPEQIAKAQMKMQDQFSDLDIFLADSCERGGSYKEIPNDLYAAYEQWCEANGSSFRDKLTNTMFGRQLTGRGIPVKMVKVDGKSVRRRFGIRLKNSQD